MIIDYTAPFPKLGSPLTPEQLAAFRAMYYKRPKSGVEEGATNLFFVEAHDNHCQPAPPDGWFGLRSSTRRVFMQLTDSGRMLAPDEINRRLRVGEFTEVPLATP